MWRLCWVWGCEAAAVAAGLSPVPTGSWEPGPRSGDVGGGVHLVSTSYLGTSVCCLSIVTGGLVSHFAYSVLCRYMHYGVACSALPLKIPVSVAAHTPCPLLGQHRQ